MATAKKKKTKKPQAKQQTPSFVNLLVTSLIGITLSIMGMLQLGIVGQWTQQTIGYLFGSYAIIIYILFIIYFLLSIYKRQWYGLTQRHPLGILIFSFGLLLLLASLALEKQGLKGIAFLDVYFKQLNFLTLGTVPKNGIIGTMGYAAFSALFDSLGTIILAVILISIGLIMVFKKQISQFLQKRKNRPKKPKAEKQVSKQQPVVNNLSKDANNLSQDEVERVKSYVMPEPKKKKLFDYENQTTKEPEVNKPSIFEYGEVSTPITKDFFNTDSNETTPVEPKPKKAVKDFNPSPSKYELPDLVLLKDIKVKEKAKDNLAYVDDTAHRLIEVLTQFGISCNISNVNIGPTVTRYEVKLAPGTRVSKVSTLQDDIKMALAAKDIRVEAPIPGKNAVGIEVPNMHNMLVSFKEILETMQDEPVLSVVLGKDINGKPVTTQLNKMPHLLVAGATGSGKSVCINTIILSLLMRTRPDQVKLVLIDPKKVELSGFNGLPHLLTPVVTNPKKASVALRRVVEIMEERYELFSHLNVKNIEAYQAIAKNDVDLPDMPYIVTIIDELSDLMMVSAKEVEESIMRITQMARAAGIHLIVATQRPSTDVITGVIKANIPSRIAFAVSSGIDSRTILDSMGAERLLGKGDMLFLKMGESSAIRIQGAFLTDADIQKVVHFIIQQVKTDIEDQLFTDDVDTQSTPNDEQQDELYQEAIEFVKNAQKASTSLLQRSFRIGYNRAARLIDQLEADGIIGPANGSKPREVLDTDE